MKKIRSYQAESGRPACAQQCVAHGHRTGAASWTGGPRPLRLVARRPIYCRAHALLALARCAHGGDCCTGQGYTGPRRWQALGRALTWHGGGRSVQRCWTAADDAAALSNSGAPGSSSSTWILAPRDSSGHNTRGKAAAAW
jgi:hypothetical protein